MFKDSDHKNEDFYEGPFAHRDFSRAGFTRCDFYDCDFTRTDFLGAIFTRCHFFNCTFNKSFITGVRLENCHFHKCEFDDAYIFRSQFKNCHIKECSMTGAMLSTVDFTGSEWDEIRWNGTLVNSAPLIIDGIEYPVIALDNGYMHIGCEFNTYEYFYTRDNRYVASTEGLRTRRFWKKNKKWIFDMLEAQGLYKP